jgi:hypothetical protein
VLCQRIDYVDRRHLAFGQPALKPGAGGYGGDGVWLAVKEQLIRVIKLSKLKLEFLPLEDP